MAETLKNLQNGREAAQNTGEVVDIQELYRRRGEKALEAARAEGLNGQATESRHENKEGRVLIDDKVDRFGNPAYNKKTLENLREKGIEQDPAEQERLEQIEAARVASAAERKEKILAALNGRSPELAIQEMQSDISKWEAEIREIEAEPASEGGRMEIAHDQQMVKEMQSRIALVESITPEERAELDRELGTDVIVETYEDGTKTVREAMPVTTAMADEDFAAEIAKEEGPIEPDEEPGAASGELDMNSPLDTDEWRIRRQAVEILKNTAGIPGDLVASVERALQEAEESAVREAQRAEGFLETAPDEMAAGPQAEDVELVKSVQVQSVQNRGEARAERVNRAELQAKVQEKLRKRPGAKHRIRRVAATVLLTLTTMATVFAGDKMTAGAATPEQIGIESTGDETTIGDVAERIKEAGIQLAMTVDSNAGSGQTSAEQAEGVQAEELVGDLNQDERYEAGNGTRYRYDDFDSTEKHGKHGFGTDKSEFWGDVDATRQSVLEINRAQPEVLAATVTGYPSILAEAGLDTNITPRELDDLLSNQDGGGELQERLYQLLEEKLGDANTKFEFYQEYGQEYSYYIKNNLGDGELSTPENLELGRSWMQRNGEKQVKIGIPVYNDDFGLVDHYEWVDLNSECGWQRNEEEVRQFVEQKAHEKYIEQVVERAIQRVEAEQEIEQVIDEGTEGEEPEGEEPTGEEPEEEPDEEEPDEEEPDEEEPDKEEPEEETPDDEEPDEEEPDEETPDDEEPEEEKKQKDLENEERLMQGEGTSAEVGKTEDVTKIEEETEKHENAEENLETKVGNAQADATASTEAQAEAAAAQAEAEANKIVDNISDEDYEEYNDSFEQRVAERQAEQRAQETGVSVAGAGGQQDTTNSASEQQ